MDNIVFSTLAYFIIYSIIGWVIESVFRSFCEKKVINSGFLKGPYCPIYGIGAIVIVTTINSVNILQENIVILFFSSLVIFTIWELIVGWLLEKIFHTKYWDYSHSKFNWKGRICLQNSIYWGILGVLANEIIHPSVQWFITTLYDKNENLLHISIYVLTTIFLIDTITSITKMKNVGNVLRRVELLNIEIKQKMELINEYGKEKIEQSEILKKLEELNYKRSKILLKTYNNFTRLKTAFPAINTKEITEVLNLKVELARSKIDEQYKKSMEKINKIKNK